MPDVSDLLAAYDEQARARVPDPLPRGVTVERDGPLLRFLGLAGRGFVIYRDLGGLEGADLDELIARQVEVFAERRERVEWKLHGHDRPKDLSQRLRAAGFLPEETETIVIAPVAQIAGEVRLPEGVSLQEVTSRDDLLRVAALEQAVWGEIRSGALARRHARVGASGRSRRAHDRRGGSRSDNRVRRVDSLRGRHRVRNPLGRRDPAGVAPARDLSCDRRLPGEARCRARVPLPRDRRLRR